MAKSKAKKVKAVSIPVPSTLSGAEALLQRIGELQREVVRIEADMSDALSVVRAAHEKSAAPFNDEIESSFKALHAYAEAHRDELCGKLKTAKLATGELSWRQRPPSVRINNAPLVIETLIVRGLRRFVREKQEVDKAAILADPDSVSGVRGITVISGIEDFVAIPFETEIERVELSAEV